MSCARPPGPPLERAEPRAADSIWAELREQLERLRRAIAREIRAYPPPIAGCDQQFNLLLERRDRVTGELGRLAALRRDGASGIEDVKRLSDFIGASACLDDELKARLLADLNGRLPTPTPTLPHRGGGSTC